MDVKQPFLALEIGVHLVALGGTLAYCGVPDGATDPVLPARALLPHHDLVARLVEYIIQAVPGSSQEGGVGLHDMVRHGIDDDEIVGDVVDDFLAEFLGRT